MVSVEKTQKTIKLAPTSRRDLYMLGGGMLSAWQTRAEVEVEVGEKVACGGRRRTPTWQR